MSANIFISGFSTVKNGVKLGYPLVESIMSILPVVDEFIITIGKSEDKTLEVVKKIGSDKVRIIETEWDPRFSVKGRILAVQSNLALFHCRGIWAFYIQADEVFHDEDQNQIVRFCEKFQNDEIVQGFLFDYTHFMGDYNWYGDSYHWYRKEIRIIRNHRGIISWRSAQSFRVDGQKINVIDTGCRIFHYGWVRSPDVMAEKRKQHDRLHHGEVYYSDVHQINYNYIYDFDTKCMKQFTGKHPKVMAKRIEDYKIDFNPSNIPNKVSLKEIRRRLVNRIGKLIGWYPGEYKNYKKLKGKKWDI